MAKLEDFTILTGDTANTIDAAMAIVDESYQVKAGHNRVPMDFNDRPVRGQIMSQDYDARDVVLGSRIGKIGRTTGYTEGTVTAVALRYFSVDNPSVRGIKIAYTNLLEVTWDSLNAATRPFSGPGDSGAVYFTLEPFRAIAIHIAAGRREDGTFVSYGCHLRPALEYFNCTLSPN